MRTALITASAVLLISSAALAGCAAAGSAHARAAVVVASTDVWGSVARAVAGGHVSVKSLLSGADVDPHSYQASPSDAAALVDAALVVYNGGGYDPWVDEVLANHRSVNAVDAYSSLGNTAASDGEPPNEHVFYNLGVAKSVANTIGERLAGIDPANAAAYRSNAAQFCRSADEIAASEHAIATAYAGDGVIATEPVVYYLLQASGLVDRSPTTFMSANENETDPSPTDMAFVLNLIRQHQVVAVLVNTQTATPAISSLEGTARRAGVPVTDVTETLPTGTDYLTWQRNTVSQVLTALQSSRHDQP